MTKIHGLSGKEIRTYSSWLAAKHRCENPRNVAFHHYGGRGISMCAEWASDFTAFFRDMGRRPVGHSLERIDVNGNYEPGNCCWIPRLEQGSNMRSNIRISWNGESRTMAEWSRHLGIGYNTLRARYKSGRPLEEVFQPAKLRNPDKPLRPLPPEGVALALRMAAGEPA